MVKYSICETLQPILSIVLIFKKIADRVLRSELDITMAQFRILVAIQHGSDLSQQKIAEFWGMTEASASRQVDILGRSGLISKTRDPRDSRKHVLKLTKKGLEDIKLASRLMNGVFDRIFKDISDKDKNNLHNLLQRFEIAMKSKVSMFNTDNIKK